MQFDIEHKASVAELIQASLLRLLKRQEPQPGSLGYCCSGCQKCGSELRSIMTSQRTVKKQLITLVGPVSIYNEMP